MNTERKPNRRRAVIAAAAAAVILIVCATPITYSYLTASSDTVINTFSGGAISLTLDEAKVDTDGNKIDGEDRVQENSYKVVPGATLYKDPTVTVLSGSEICYVYLYVENPLDEDYFTLNYSSDWKEVATTGTKTLYVYRTTVDASDGDVALTPIFTTVTVSDELTSEQIETMGEVQIKVQAYAVQAEGVSVSDSIQMAVSYFGAEFEIEFTDVKTDIEISGLITEEADTAEDTEETDTSSDTTEAESSSDETDTMDSSASGEALDETDTSAEDSESTSSEDVAAAESSDSSGDAAALNSTP